MYRGPELRATEWWSCVYFQHHQTVNNSTLRQCQIPQVKGSVPQGQPSPPRPPFQKPVVSPGCHLCFCTTSHKSEIPIAPYFWIDYFARAVHRIKETAYPLDSRFIIKAYSSGTARWKRCTGQSMGKSVWSSHAFFGWAIHPRPPGIHQFRDLEPPF